MAVRSEFINVCFTLNNYTEEDYKKFQEWDNVSYIIIGKEEGKEGTKHLQGYAELKKKMSLVALKKFSEKCHWERRKGTGEQASKYCEKEKDFWKQGELKVSKQGKRNDLLEMKQQVKKHGMRHLFREGELPNMQEIRVMEKYMSYCEEERNWKPEVIWLWGASGVGKSRKAWELTEGMDVYVKDGEKWWDGLDRHPAIIIDDFRAGNMKFNYLLRVLDRYPMRVEVKGGYRQLLARKIIITSIVHPSQSYSVDDEPMKQLIRRIDKIIHVKEKIDFVCVNEDKEYELVVDKEMTQCAAPEVGGNTVDPDFERDYVMHQ